LDLSIIIPAYNRAETIETTLWSLIRQDFDPQRYEIIVVDNNSQDQTAAVVQEIQSQSPVAIRYLLETRQGVHYARNLGATHARGAILYYTDDDMVAEAGMLRELLNLFKLDPMVATATGRVLPKWECEPPAWVRKYCMNSLLSLQLRPEDLIIAAGDVGVYSCHQAIRKDVLLECGGFNPENTGGTWVGDGESGLNLKVGAHGYKFAYTAKAVTYHMIPPGRMTQQYLNRRMENQGYADAYTWFRAARPDNVRLVRDQIRCLLKCGHENLSTASRFLLQRETWRLHRAQVSYHYGRFKYNGRLRRDAAWREFVLKDNWMSEADCSNTALDSRRTDS
jgi:glycosyltransferase involved in cell wall biosynthesis